MTHIHHALPSQFYQMSGVVLLINIFVFLYLSVPIAIDPYNN